MTARNAVPFRAPGLQGCAGKAGAAHVINAPMELIPFLNGVREE
ncbi:hypothetical protein [uncultured Mailhella sp.]|nr:hypothetical protein [uncultured Mailhella sp.]